MTQKEILKVSDSMLEDEKYMLEAEIEEAERKLLLVTNEIWYRKNPDCRPKQ